MKALTAIVALVFATGGAFAAEGKKEPSEAQKAQQEKMKFCNADAKEKALTGDERKQFMSNCLKKAPAEAAPAAAPAEASPAAAPAKTSQQNKMKECNATASSKGLKGDERKAFMSECLKA
ncbi:MAG: Phosphate starvation-inducible protein PsiF precursor [Candidatus Accumulibacter appositus]|uniref:Phosphate starvation-inducible protein PsiF n=1 Tax=Candidatus Accumulibacter appositus TaxID=1454003 RepID=A0A011PN61_9PROT|nr:PsiF family protein [Accumulibacter sp.]EXI78457.1 MAG: Phosphate starvation-inducible protein PsiF precursor [Candidatus Accumulibacter appositus]HRF04287.1 PsiF family protein [Accumulibacter sp.]